MTTFNIAPIGSSTHWMGPATWYRRPPNQERIRRRPSHVTTRTVTRVPLDTTRGTAIDLHV